MTVVQLNPQLGGTPSDKWALPRTALNGKRQELNWSKLENAKNSNSQLSVPFATLFPKFNRGGMLPAEVGEQWVEYIEGGKKRKRGDKGEKKAKVQRAVAKRRK